MLAELPFPKGGENFTQEAIRQLHLQCVKFLHVSNSDTTLNFINRSSSNESANYQDPQQNV
jgi:hypothetical protein